MKRIAGLLFLLTLALAAQAQQTLPPARDSAPPAQVAPQSNADFLRAADEVLADMSRILDLPVKQPLKKSIRSKQQIRDYLVHEEKEDKDDAQRYADTKALEAFGLIPRGFPLDSFMLDVLTDQVAGLYDPEAKEFYIADWMPLDDQREVMAHELTHALEDQYFNVEPWIKAARPNDDAEFARDSVSEGTAMAAMVDYTLRDERISVRDLPDVTALVRSGAVAEMSKDPELSKAPMFIQDELLFPYLAGTDFSQQFLKAHTGWPDLKLVFDNPPVSTQQIIHPDLYLKGVKPRDLKFPAWTGVVPAGWNLLEENVLGEFGFGEVLKQFLDERIADSVSPAWAGDRYALFEDSKSKNIALVFRLELDTSEDAAHFFGVYSEALEKKYAKRTNLFRRPGANYFQFDMDTGGVFLRCLGEHCLTVEGATRETYNKITAALGWPAPPSPSSANLPKSITKLDPSAPPMPAPAGGFTLSLAPTPSTL